MKILIYSVLRILAFVIPFAIMWMFPIFREVPWLAAIFAAIIGLCLSLLFLRKPLNDVTAPMAARRRHVDVADEVAEDEYADSLTNDTAADNR